MKKETVSVLKPRNGKQSDTKVKKLAKKKPGKFEKNNVIKNISSIEPRGKKKLRIIGIENVVGNNLKNLENIKLKLGNLEKVTSLPVTSVKKGKNKNAQNNATANGKMAAVRKHSEVETRGSPKKSKIHTADDFSAAPVKSGQKRKSKIEHADEIKGVNSKIATKGEKKRKLKMQTVDEAEKAIPEVSTKREKNQKSKIEAADKPEKIKPEVPKSEKKRKSKIAVVDKPEKIKPEVPGTKKKRKSKIETSDDLKPEVTTKLSKRSIKMPAKKAHIEDTGDLKLTKKHVLESVESILKLSSKELNSKKSLLPMENDPVFLQVICIKVAKTPRRQIRPYLPHPLAGPLDDIALFVPDLELGRRKDYEKTVDHWETKFREKGIDCIKEIIPMNRVKTEYSQFEMRRKLAQSFDYFLADGRICGHLTHLLGRGFYNRRSAPTPVKLLRDNLKEELKFALHKTCMEIHGFGNSHSVQVGNVSMEATKLAENVWATCEALAEHYPGGWANVRAIRIKTRTSLAIPIYLTLKSKNKTAAPVVKPKRPRAYETVEGELTTLPGSASVTVTPEGKIKLKRERDFDGEDENEVKEEGDDEVDEGDEDENDEVKEEDDKDEQ